MVASGKESDFQCRRCKRLRFDPGSGRFPGYANSFQYSCLGNPWTEEPGRLQSMGLQRVGYILVTKRAGKESLLNLVLETEILFSEEQYLTWILNQIEERVITSKQAEKLKRQTWSQTERGLGLSESQPRRDLQVKGRMSRVSGSRWRSRRSLLISSCKSTKITTSCWTATDRRMLESTKEKYSTPKDKEEMAGDGRRGTITIKSNPIHTGWVTHKLENNNTKKITHHCEGLELHVRLLAWGPNKGTGNLQRIWLGRLVGFDYKTSTELGETETLLLEGTNKTLHAPRVKGKEQWLHRKLNQNYLQCWRVSCGGVGQQGLITGTEGTGSSCLGMSPLV